MILSRGRPWAKHLRLEPTRISSRALLRCPIPVTVTERHRSHTTIRDLAVAMRQLRYGFLLTTPSSAPKHPAPERTWRPLSGLAVLSFILAVAGVVVSLYWWWVEIIPFILGLGVLFGVSRRLRRGHALAIAAVVISLAVGSCSYRANADHKRHIREVSTSLLSALRPDIAGDVRDDAMRPWFRTDALDRGVLDDVIKRHHVVEAEFGSFQGEVDTGGFFDSAFQRWTQPHHLVEIGNDTPAPPLQVGTVWWVPASYERGTVFVGVHLFQGKPDLGQMLGLAREGKMKPGVRAPIVADLRFYRQGDGK